MGPISLKSMRGVRAPPSRRFWSTFSAGGTVRLYITSKRPLCADGLRLEKSSRCRPTPVLADDAEEAAARTLKQLFDEGES